jgi:hypothetical protein
MTLAYGGTKGNILNSDAQLIISVKLKPKFKFLRGRQVVA